jgi:ABC-2 type transport system ATP-binding protein
MTVLYTTHYMEEAAELSDHIAIMDRGKLIAYGTHADLIKMVGEQTRIDITVNTEAKTVLPEWRAMEGVLGIDAAAGDADSGSTRLIALVNDTNRVLPRLFEAAAPLGVRITSIDIQEPNLETVFLHLTGRALRD